MSDRISDQVLTRTTFLAFLGRQRCMSAPVVLLVHETTFFRALEHGIIFTQIVFETTENFKITKQQTYFKFSEHRKDVSVFFAYFSAQPSFLVQVLMNAEDF